MFVVRNYQSDDRPHGEDPNLFDEIVSQFDTMGRQLDIFIYLNPSCETDKFIYLCSVFESPGVSQ